MPYLITNFRYRPEIDGLRALAVLLVVFFHAGLGISGGYVGVDVFFVISGFLITSLIIIDLEAGKFTLANFWERRARRIMPAMVVVVLSTLIAGWFLLLPSEFIILGRTSAWQAVFGANINFWYNTGYFEGNAEEQPLLHMWSLAVEEQFYLVVPLLLIGLFHFKVFHRRKAILTLFAIFIISSLVLSIWGVNHYPVATFYLLPTRAWELMCGSFIALLPLNSAPKSRWLRESLSSLGIMSIVAPAFLYTKSTLFPGLAAVLPCFGAALYIWASTKRDDLHLWKLPMVARGFSLRPMVFIGLISYSLYLWHWPFFAYSNYWALEPKTLTKSLAIVGVSFVLAVLTWRYVETPFRKKIVCAKRNSIFAFGTLSITTVFVIGIVLMNGNGFPSRFTDQVNGYASAKENMGGVHELTTEDILDERLISIGNLAFTSPVKFLLWGDSHGMAAAPAFDQYLKSKGVAGLQATRSAMAPILGAYWQSGVNRNSAITFNAAVFNYIKQHQIRNVVLIGRWEYYTDEKASDFSLDTALLSTVKQLVEIGSRPWIMLQVPTYHFNVPRALAMTSIFEIDLTNVLAPPKEWNGLYGDDESIIKKIQAAGGQIIDPRPCFLDNSQKYFLLENNGISFYADAHHLTVAGALTLLPCLNNNFHLDGM